MHLDDKDFEFGNPIARHYAGSIEGICRRSLLEEQAYRSLNVLSSTDIRELSHNPGKWALKTALKITNKTPPWLFDEDTDAYAFGRALHCAALEPMRFKSHSIVLPYFKSFVLKDARAAKEMAQSEVGPGGFVLKAQEGWAIANILSRIKGFGIDLSKTENEFPLVGHYGDYSYKGRIDAYDHKTGTVYDIKTTGSFDDWDDTSKKYKSFAQAYHYSLLLKLDNRPVNKFVFVVCEKEIPFRVKLVTLEPDTPYWDIAQSDWVIGVSNYQTISQASSVEEFNKIL